MKKLLSIIFITTIVVLLFFFLGGGPVEYNWNKNFRTDNDNPYGCEITLKMLPDIFTKSIVEIDNQTIVTTEGYETYQLDEISTNEWGDDNIYSLDEQEDHIVDYSEENNQTETINKLHNYAIVNLVFSPGDFESKALLYHTKLGNEIFLATHSIPNIIRNQLGFGITKQWGDDPDSVTINFNSEYSGDQNSYIYDRETADYYISFYDEESSEIIAENDDGKPILMRVQYGKGNFYICTLPIAFTNYHILDAANSEFASISLSQLKDRKLHWISGRGYYARNDDLQSINDQTFNDNEEFDNERGSKLELLKENPPLWWAFILIILVGIVFFLFGTKRKQRTIPIVKPHQNSTIAFVKIIAELYFQKSDHKNIAMKKINYFLEYVRSSFYVKTINFDEELFTKVSERSGVNYEIVNELFATIANIRSKRQITQTELLNVSNQLEKFKKESKI